MVKDHEHSRGTFLAEGGIGHQLKMGRRLLPRRAQKGHTLAAPGRDEERAVSLQPVPGSRALPEATGVSELTRRRAGGQGVRKQAGSAKSMPALRLTSRQFFAEGGIGQWSTPPSAARAEGHTLAAPGTDTWMTHRPVADAPST